MFTIKDIFQFHWEFENNVQLYIFSYINAIHSEYDVLIDSLHYAGTCSLT
jgi:hypothetical protein